jgi:hypothetical protein
MADETNILGDVADNEGGDEKTGGLSGWFCRIGMTGNVRFKKGG